MKRLNRYNRNTPETHIVKQPNWFDIKRKKLLGKYYKTGHWLDLGSEKDNIEIINSLFENDCKYEVKWVKLPLNYENNYFSYITAGQLLEHLNEPKTLIKEVNRVLKPGGIFAVSVPYNETELGEVDKQHHIWSFSKEDLIELLSPYGKLKIKIIGSQWLPKYKYHFKHIIVWMTKNK